MASGWATFAKWVHFVRFEVVRSYPVGHPKMGCEIALLEALTLRDANHFSVVVVFNSL